MKNEHMTLAKSLREGSYIWNGDSVVGFRPPTRTELKAAEAIESLVKCLDVTDKSWRSIADELNAYKELGTIEHIRELVEAENENRLKIKPVKKYVTCGSCKSFIRTEGKPYGICKKREYVIGDGPDKKVRNFVPYQSRKACAKEYEPREEKTDVAE